MWVSLNQTTPASYNIPVLLLIYKLKSGKSLGSDRGTKKIYVKTVKDLLPFEIWINHNRQPDCDDDLKIIVAMTST